MLQLFSDNFENKKAPFSIRNIVKKALEEFNLQPGQWFRSTTITMTFEELLKIYPHPYTRNLEIITFTDSVIIVEDLYERIFKKPFISQKRN